MFQKLPARLGLSSGAACLLLAGCHVVIPYDSQTSPGAPLAEAGVDATLDAGVDLRPDAATQQIARVPTVSPLGLFEPSSGVNAQLLCGIATLTVRLSVGAATLPAVEECAELEVARAGYYRLSGPTLADSCATQTDESGFLLIRNSRNPGGYPIEGDEELERPLIVPDGDNTACPAPPGQCPVGSRCVAGDNGGECCWEENLLYGTFWLERTNNEVCLFHLCWFKIPEFTGIDPIYADDFVGEEGCQRSNSIDVHARVTGTGSGSEVVACLEPP